MKSIFINCILDVPILRSRTDGEISSAHTHTHDLLFFHDFTYQVYNDKPNATSSTTTATIDDDDDDGDSRYRVTLIKIC